MKSLSLSKPHVIVVTGIPGSGKSFFAEKFADTFNTPRVNYDAIATLTGNNDAADVIATSQLSELLKTKLSVVVEGMACTRADRLDITKAARSAGYDTLLVWVQTDPATSKARSQKDKGLSSEAYDAAVKKFAPPSKLEHPVVISGKHTYATQAKIILKKLTSPRGEISTHSTPPTRIEPTTSTRRNITIR